ncbi:hypothetical protein LAZ67_14000994 [Cordylochernes scorpioides]|uniref:Transposase n=1 Tax=Cordylochernes scorpioides TaxID=51811 RepID=A0ABY6L9D9_9ARAC|nr:hypothetical protein LAZ67_14000994 [Cordylochernes scorpioides]
MALVSLGRTLFHEIHTGSNGIFTIYQRALQSLVENHQRVSSDTTYFVIYEEYECAESYPKGFMVACGISYEGKLKIRKVERNAKINSEYYQNNILEPIFLNDIPSIYGKQSNKVWFHHDNATSHTSSSTQAYLEDLRQRTGINTIPKTRTPVKSPDLAPMDFCIFGCLKRALGKRHHRTIEGLWKVAKVNAPGQRTTLRASRTSSVCYQLIISADDFVNYDQQPWRCPVEL